MQEHQVWVYSAFKSTLVCTCKNRKCEQFTSKFTPPAT